MNHFLDMGILLHFFPAFLLQLLIAKFLQVIFNRRLLLLTDLQDFPYQEKYRDYHQGKNKDIQNHKQYNQTHPSFLPPEW